MSSKDEIILDLLNWINFFEQRHKIQWSHRGRAKFDESITRAHAALTVSKRDGKTIRSQQQLDTRSSSPGQDTGGSEGGQNLGNTYYG